MRGRLAVLTVALLVTGCAEDSDALPDACVQGHETVLTALAQAPRAVALPDGTRLSSCVSAARTDGDLQSLAIVFVRAADTLRPRAATDPAAALRLGYLAGAVKAGATRSSGSIATQLARRVEQVATLDSGASAASAAALAQGRTSGERSG